MDLTVKLAGLCTVVVLTILVKTLTFCKKCNQQIHLQGAKKSKEICVSSCCVKYAQSSICSKQVLLLLLIGKIWKN